MKLSEVMRSSCAQPVLNEECAVIIVYPGDAARALSRLAAVSTGVPEEAARNPTSARAGAPGEASERAEFVRLSAVPIPIPPELLAAPSRELLGTSTSL